jgi:hypothetical protein
MGDTKFQIVLSQEAFLLAQLLIQNAISAIYNKVASMTPEEVTAAIPLEELRHQRIIDETKSH